MFNSVFLSKDAMFDLEQPSLPKKKALIKSKFSPEHPLHIQHQITNQ